MSERLSIGQIPGRRERPADLRYGSQVVSSRRTPLAQSLAPSAIDAQALELRAPWGVRGSGYDGGGLYIILDGSCHFRVRGRSWRLEQGDALFLPVGDPHQMMDHPSSATVPVEELCRTATRSDGKMLFGGTGPLTRLLTVGFLFETRRPWLDGLSPMHLCAATRSSLVEWLIASANLLRTELPMEAKTEIVRAMMKVVYTVALMDPAVAPLSSHDDRIGRAYNQMHREPSRRWTVDALASVAGMSRSSFAAAFATCLGEAPIRHLRRLRLERARTLSQEGIARKVLAGTVGYASGRSLGRALRRSKSSPPRRAEEVPTASGRFPPSPASKM